MPLCGAPVPPQRLPKLGSSRSLTGAGGPTSGRGSKSSSRLSDREPEEDYGGEDYGEGEGAGYGLDAAAAMHELHELLKIRAGLRATGT